MIIKSISYKSKDFGKLIRYVIADGKLEPSKEQVKKNLYVPGVKLSKQDLKHLYSEQVDAKLLHELKEAGGNIKKFVADLISKSTEKSRASESEKIDKTISPIIFKQNIRSRSIKSYIKEFEENEKFRLHRRSNNVTAYHTILSFSQKDSENITPKILKDIGNQFISLKGSNSLFLGAVHQDKDHLHIHLIQSGVQYCTGLANRVSMQEFQDLKKTMTDYQLKKYPFLVHSLPAHGKSKNLDKEGLKKYKTAERTTVKTSLQGCIETAMTAATSTDHFITHLQELGYSAYYRAGRLTGVQSANGLKFRLSRLGADLDRLKLLDAQKGKEEATLKEIGKLRGHGKEIGKVKGASHGKEATNTKSIDETIKGMNEQDQRKELQGLVNRNREFERNNNITDSRLSSASENTELQELKNIRESRGNEMDREERNEDAGRDIDDEKSSEDDTDDRNSKEADDSCTDTNDDAEDDKNTGMDSDDDSDDPGQE